MTIFPPQMFHQKAKNPRKLPIYPKFDVPKVPEVYGSAISQQPASEPVKCRFLSVHTYYTRDDPMTRKI